MVLFPTRCCLSPYVTPPRQSSSPPAARPAASPVPRPGGPRLRPGQRAQCQQRLELRGELTGGAGQNSDEVGEETGDELPQVADTGADGARRAGEPLPLRLEREDQQAVGRAGESREDETERGTGGHYRCCCRRLAQAPRERVQHRPRGHRHHPPRLRPGVHAGRGRATGGRAIKVPRRRAPHLRGQHLLHPLRRPGADAARAQHSRPANELIAYFTTFSSLNCFSKFR
jgi:hypothetical protein